MPPPKPSPFPNPPPIPPPDPPSTPPLKPPSFPKPLPRLPPLLKPPPTSPPSPPPIPNPPPPPSSPPLPNPPPTPPPAPPPYPNPPPASPIRPPPFMIPPPRPAPYPKPPLTTPPTPLPFPNPPPPPPPTPPLVHNLGSGFQQSREREVEVSDMDGKDSVDDAHEHVCSLCEQDQDAEGATCSFCSERWSGTDPTYKCIECSIYIHGSCYEAGSLSKLLIPFDRHPLQLRRVVEDVPYYCVACCSRLTDLFYSCDTCSIHLHVDCALLRPPIVEDEKQIQHPCHLHPLSFVLKDAQEAIKCRLCNRICSGSAYTCRPCNLFIHKSCAEHPLEVKHPCHPFHALKLSPFCNFTCYACHKVQCGFPYLCHGCDISLDIQCALFASQSRFRSLKLKKHESHLHPLSLIDHGDGGEMLPCRACEKKCSGPTYCCSLCKFYLHPSCTELPREVTISGDVGLTLDRTLQHRYRCDCCKKEKGGFLYKNVEESVMMDTECAVLIHKANSSDHVFPSSHCHPLFFMEEIDDIRCSCRLCLRNCSVAAYGCTPCNYFLHKSCADLADQIEHPFHRMHPLKLSNAEQPSCCKLCSNTCKGLLYRCSEGCDFKLDIGCSSIKSVIRYDGHPHPLVFLEKVPQTILCHYCKHWRKPSVFRCLECDFALELSCGPLPCTIEHKNLVFTLTDTFVRENSEECLCDDCEQRRNPQQCVYRSEYADYTVELKCAMPKIILALKGELGDVELRTVGRRITGKVITEVLADGEDEHQKEGIENEADSMSFEQIQISLDRDEMNEVKKLWREHLKDTKRAKDIDEADLFENSEEAFRLFMESLDIDEPDSYFAFSKKSTGSDEVNFVKAGAADYWISRRNQPLHREMLDTFGEISSGCKFSPMVKTYLLHHLFATICSMQRTLVVNITKDTLSRWWHYLRLVQDVGFQVQPLVDNLKRLVHAYLGLQIRKSGEDMDGQTARATKEIGKKEVELEKVETERERYSRLVKGEKTSLMKKCLAEASTLKWKTVGELLL